MKKIISLIGMFAVLGVAAGDAHGVAMNANIRRLLQEKQDKIAKLEECEGKKQGWMIAGISTIGLTAVGVGVNIAQASKSNRLSDEIEMEKTTLQRQQDELDRIQNDIATKQAEKAEEERKRAEEEEHRRNNAARANAGNSSVNVEVNPIPVLDNPDGKIGDPCGENGEGQWTEMTDGIKKCSNENGLVNCECIKNVQADVEPVSPVKPEKDCRTSHGKKPTTDCPCDGDKGLLNFGRGKCECKPGEEWDDQKCVGKKDEKKDDKKPAGQCIKTYEEYLGVGCVCDSGKGLIPVLDDMSSKRYCGCGMSDTWNGTKCVSSNTAFKPKGNYTVSYGGETWNGIGACSSVPGGNAGNVVNEQSKVQRAYDNYKVTDDNGENCYCKIIDPKKSSWVFSYRFDNLAECVTWCVARCQRHISREYPEFQKNVFDTIM